MAQTRALAPYAGEQPYLYLCAAASDRKHIRPLLSRLFRRGVRVWYEADGARSQEEHRLRDRRMADAALVLIYVSDAFRADVDAKSRAQACQARGQKLVCLNTGSGGNALSIGLKPDTPTLPLKNAVPEEIEDAIVRAPGFTRELLGDPIDGGSGRIKALAVVLSALAALVLIGALLYSYLRPKEETPAIAPPEDTVTFSDPMLSEAVRLAVSGPLTEESLAGVTELTLYALPDDLSELSKLSNLARITLTQDAALANAEQVLTLSDTYEIDLIGGDGT